MISHPQWRGFFGGVMILAIIGVAGPGRAAAPVSRPPTGEAAGTLTLTYVANMGVMVSSGVTKVLVDALFDKPNPDYRAPAPETLDRIMKGAAPFDGVDLVLVTHNHPDHFDPGLAVRYLEARPEPLLAAPADAVEAMRRAAADWAKIGPRVVTIDLQVGEKKSLNLKGLTVTACRTLHSGDLDAPMNLMYIVEMEGRRVWHEGDTTGKPEVFRAFGLDKTPVDLAVVHFWLPLEPNAARFLQEDLKAGHIALAHLPIRLEGDAPGKIGLVRDHYKDLFLLLPGMPDQDLRAAPAAGAGMITDAGTGYPVLFYSGRDDNKDVYILEPGESEPRNLTNHPATDLCPAAAPDGRRILFLSDRGGNMDIFNMAPDGSDVRCLAASPETEAHPEFTPDGKRILFVRDFDKRTEIWIMNADGSEARRLTHNEARDERPFMSPDGSKIILMSNRDGNYEIYTMAPDGSGQTRLTNTPELEIFPVWSPDGTRIAYARKFRAEGRMQGMIRVMNADGSGDRAVTATETRDENPMWSPDGRHILLQSLRDGNSEVYQVDLDGGGAVRLTDHPAWDGWASYLPALRRSAADKRDTCFGYPGGSITAR
jgi:TolB protein